MEYQIKNIFCKNHPENVQQKLVPDLYNIVLVNNPKEPLRARNYFESKIFWKRIIKKPDKKVILFFLLNPVPFNRQNYQK